MDDTVWLFLALKPHVQFQHFSFCPSHCTTKMSLSSSSSNHISPQYICSASSSKKLIVTILSSYISHQIWYSECNLCNNTDGPCLMPFSLMPFAILHHFHFQLDSLWLATHLDDAKKVWNMWHKTKLGGCVLTANYIRCCVHFLFSSGHVVYLCLFSLVLSTNATTHPVEEKKKQT